MAVTLSENLSRERYSVRYKLHPSESRSWRALYPWLVDSQVEVLDNSRTSVYEELSAATVTVGSFSTALIEGFAWGVKALVLKNCPFSDIMEPFHKLGLVSFVSNAQDLHECVVKSSGNPIPMEVVESLFAPDSAATIACHLQGCVNEKNG